MAKKYVQRTLDVHVKGHKRHDPRINKDVDVKDYKRTQDIKPYKAVKQSSKPPSKFPPKKALLDPDEFLKWMEKNKQGIEEELNPLEELYFITNDKEKQIIQMKALTEEIKEMIKILERGDLDDFPIAKAELKERMERKQLDALKEIIIEKSLKDPEMYEKLLNLNKDQLAFFSNEDQHRIKLLQDFWKGELKPISENKVKPKQESKRFDELPEDMTKEDLKEYKRLYGLETLNYITSEAGFEDNNQGKHAIWRGKETQAFIEWKKSFKSDAKKPIYLHYEDTEKVKKEIELRKATKRRIKFTVRPNQKTKKYFMYYESDVPIPEAERKLKDIATKRGYLNTVIIKNRPTIKGSDFITLDFKQKK